MDNSSHKLFVAAVMGMIILGFGTLGYRILEDWNWLDAFYMTIITVATIGYGEIRPLSEPGRIFTILLIVFGVGNMAYVVGQITRGMVEGSLRRVLGRRKLENLIKKLEGHYVLCGYGRIGRMIAKEIRAKGLPLVVIENHENVMEDMEKDEVLYVRGDASDEDNLIAAGIERAAGLVSAVSSDADNLYIILTARDLNPDIFVLTRASEERSLKRLQGAGADRVISPYLIGARKMAQALLRPTVADFLESTVHGASGMSLAMEEIYVTESSRLNDISLLDSNIRRDLDIIVIAIKTKNGEMVFNPSATTRISIGDTLIAVGQRENMDRLVELLGGAEAAHTRRVKSSRRSSSVFSPD